MTPDGERSEPRRPTKAEDGLLDAIERLNETNDRLRAENAQLRDIAELRVVEPGHDEQTGLRNTESVIRADERERTVAAVVEALRDRTDFSTSDGVADACQTAAIFIEERFKSSAPGGDK